MFIIELTYKTSLEEVDEHIESHIDYLNEQYKQGNFIVSGRKKPRNGGIILSKMSNRGDLIKILDQDPFKVFKIAEYRITEFIPTKVNSGFEALLEEI